MKAEVKKRLRESQEDLFIEGLRILGSKVGEIENDVKGLRAEIRESRTSDAPGQEDSRAMKKVKSGLDKAEQKLAGEPSDSKENVPLEKTELDDLDDVDVDTIRKLEEKGMKVIYPNLKYKEPKYEGVESVLNYVEDEESEDDGVKLVIMNFND